MIISVHFVNKVIVLNNLIIKMILLIGINIMLLMMILMMSSSMIQLIIKLMKNLKMFLLEFEFNLK